MARMLDFRYTQYKRPIPRPDGAVVLGVATFNMRGDRDNGNDDFKDALADLKNEISWQDRDWNDADRLWTVQVTEDTKASLCAIFENAIDLFDAAERQLELPWE